MRQNQKGNDKEFLITDKLLETGKEENQRNIHVSAVRDPWIDRDHSKECSVNSPFDQYQYTIPISPSAFKYIFEENYYNCRMNKNSRLSITCPHNLALLSNIYSGATDEISMKSKMNYSDDDGYSSAQTSSTTCTAAVQHSTTNTIYIPYSTKLFYQIRKRSRSFQHFNNSQQSHLVSLEETTNYLLNLSIPKHLDQTTLPVTQKNEKCSSKAIKSEIYLISSKEEKKAIEGSENTKPNRLDVSINTDKRDSKIQRIPHTTEQMKEVISQEEERAGVLSNESNKQSLNTMESDSVDSLGGVNSATDLRIQLNLKKDNPPRKNVRFVQQQNLIPRMSNNLLKSSQSTVPNYTPEMLEAIDLSETTASPPIDSVEAINFSSLRLRKILQLFGWEIDRRRNRQSTPNILDSELVERKKKWDDLFNSNILEDLMVNLNYCANVMESVYIEETRRLMNEDDILSEVEPDIVPTEVRDWLAMTFTRSMSNIKKKPERKHNFKIIANVIRAGLVVDKMFRRMSSSATYSGCNSAVESLLKQQAHIWGTDVFQLNNLSDNHSLKAMSLYLLNKTRLTSKLKIDNGKLNTFLLAIEEGYSKHGNPYHNLVHAADILQTTYYILTDSSLIHWLTEVEKFAVLFAAIIHDYEHTGTTNNFHVQTNSDFALLYNDRAVLENHHISSAFRLFSDPNLNIVASLSREQYREFRDLVIEMVLATDMSLHFQQVKTMTNLLSLPENLEKIDKSKALSLILHTADISHPAKRWELHHKWTLRLIEEFFKQGDKEFDLNIPYSPLCDRHTTHVAKSQIGFINYIVEPSFNLLSDMLETIIPLAEREESSPDSLSVDTNNDSKIIDKEAKSCSASVNTISVFGITWFRHGPLPKPWADELKQNKIIWTERAEKEDEQKLMESKEKAEDNGPGSTDDPPEVSEENEAELKK